MKDKTIHIKSFGCQMNKLDTALVASSLQDAGFGLTESVKDADVVLQSLDNGAVDFISKPQGRSITLTGTSIWEAVIQ